MIPQLVLRFFTPKIIKAILKYVFEKNELDIKCEELDVQMMDIERKCTDIGFKVTAIQDVLKDVLKDLGEDQHPPAIDLKEGKQMKADMKKIRNKGAFKKL